MQALLHPLALVLVAAAGCVFVFEAENQWLSLPFALAVVFTLFAVAFLVSGRLGFSVYLTWGAVGLVTVISAIKYKLKGFSLHFYDIVFFATDVEVHRFLANSFLPLLLGVAALLVAGLGFAAVLYRHDARTVWPTAWRTLPLALSAALLPLTFPAEAQDERLFYYMRGRQMSAFFVSLLDLGNLFTRSELEARLHAMPPQAPFPDSVDCGNKSKLPDIYLVLSESQIDPQVFPQLHTDKDRWHDLAPLTGNMKPMSVETFGGGTWITNLSLMSGISSTDFGWRGPYLTVLLENHVSGALPEILARCGYRTVSQTPMNESFVNDGPYMHSIGIETVIDIEDLAAPDYHMRDDFYFAKAEAFIEKHHKEDGRPLFLEIQTMFPHSPFNERLEPAIVVAGEPLHADAGVAEYMRRMVIARGDLETFLEARRDEAAGHPSVILEFGDHQTFVTKSFADAAGPAGALSTPGSLAYRTYYETTAFGRDLEKPLPDFEALDVAFVAPTLLDVAGLPMTPMMADLLALRDHCHGLFYACPDRAAVDRHLRRRVDSGMLRLFPAEHAAAIALVDPAGAKRQVPSQSALR